MPLHGEASIHCCPMAGASSFVLSYPKMRGPTYLPDAGCEDVCKQLLLVLSPQKQEEILW